MKNARNNGQKRVKNCLKWTASGLLLALMFVLVFAGTLSGAFGIERNSVFSVTQSTSTKASTLYWTDAVDSKQFNITRQAQYWNVVSTPSNTTAYTGTSNIGFHVTEAMKNYSLTVGSAIHKIILNDFSATSITISYQVQLFTDRGSRLGFQYVRNGAGLSFSTDGTNYNWVSTDKGNCDEFRADSGGQACYYNTKDGDTVDSGMLSGTFTGDFKAGTTLYFRYTDGWYAEDREIKTGSYAQLTSLAVSFGGVTTTINLVSGANGSISPSGTQTFNSSTASVTSTATPNDGYHFDGWYNGTAKAFENNPQTFTGSNITAKATYTAQFGLNQLIVRYWQNIDNNDNTLLNDSSGNTFTYNTKKAFLNLPKTDDGKTFVGWSTSRSGAVVHAYDTSFEVGDSTIGDTSILPAENHGATVDLYAVWVDSDFGVLTGHTADETWGTINNPFVIQNAQHLINLSDIVNDRRDPVNSVDGEYFGANINTAASDIKFANCYFVVAADLGADTPIELVPIGKDGTHYFAGTIFGGNDSDANNRTMRTINLNIQQSGVDNVGLFGYVKGASISYIKTAGTIVGGAAVGGLVGYADGVTISNCRNNATVKATGNAATFEGKQGAYLGGFVGYATASVTIKNCYNGGEITTETKWENSNIVGGIVGHLETGGQVSYCYNIGKVVGSDNIGGIVGINNGTVSFCYQGGGLNDLYSGTKPSNFITSNGGTITNCWILPSASQTGFNQSTIPNGKKLELFDSNNQKNANMYAPVVVDGNTYIVPTGNWESIVEKDINGFEVFVADTNGNKLLLKKGEYLRSATASDWATTATPTIIDSNATANRNGQTIQNSTEIDIVYVYSATVGNDVFVSHSRIGKTVSNTTYNGQNQDIGNIANLPTDTDAGVFYFEKGNAASTATSNKKDWREGGYVVVVDIKIGDKVVGRDVFDWSIEKKTLTVEDQWTFGLYNNVSVVYNGAQQGLLSFEIKGFVANESVASGNATVALTYTNTDYTLVGSKYTLNVDKSTNEGQYGVSFTLEANNYALDTNATHAFSWTISRKSITIGQSSFYYGTNIEQKLTDGTVFQNLVSGHSVRVDTQKHNFYKQNIGNNQYTILQSDITVNDNSGQPVTGNYNITGGVIITVLAGDFWSDGTTDIANNPWGSPRNPYVIGKKEQLTRLSSIVGGTSALNSTKSDTYVYVQAQSGDYSGAYFKLADNIPSVGNITPIGSNTHSFAGNFDGNKKTISGLNISVAGNNVGLFGYISGATIKNLTVNGSVKGSSNVGGVVGYALNSTIENVTNNASISSTYKDAPYEIKQFDAHPHDTTNQAVSKVNDGDLESKYYSAKKGAMSFIVQNTTLAYIFGFAITNANDTNNTAEIQKRTPQSAIIWGSNNDFQRDNYTSGGGNTTIPYEWGWEEVYNSTLAMPSTNSYRKEFFSGFKLRNYKYYYIYVKAADNYSTLQFAEFDLLTTNSQNVGGVVGYAQGTSINKATNTANVEGDTKVGGIVGNADSTSRMYGLVVNSGNITANSMVGGVSGENHGFWSDTNSNYGTFKNSGSINGRNGATVGGVTAFADKEMRNAENTGNVIGGNAVGGVAGRVQAPIKNSYNSGKIIGTNPTAQGEISGTPNGVFVGGIIGYTTSVGTISNCYNKGHIAAHSASGDYINNGDYVGGIVGFAQAKVEYCANIGGLIEGNNFIGGIVGSALDNTNIDYCYDVQGQRKFRWDGCNHGSITGSGGNVTNSWAINEKQVQTTANNPNPVVSTKGFRLTTAFAVTPQVDLQNTTNQKWEDILSSKINGFKVVGSVAKNEFFCSDNGTDTKYVKPSKTEGFAGDNGDVTAWYSATIASNIRVRVQNITLPTIGSKEYDRLAHGFGHTTYPNTANGAAANNPIVYTTEFLYVGTTYKENLNVSPTNVDVYNTTVTIKIDGQIVGVKKGDTVTITERLLKVSNVWTSASEHVAGDTSNIYIFHYNTQHQGIKANGISVVSVHGGFAIPQDVYTIGGYVETKQAHNDTTHTRTFTLNDIRNYKIENKYSQYDDFSPNTVLTEDTSDRGISEATVGDTLVVTYTWKIVPYSLATNIISGNVWFGGTTNLIVGNQAIANVEVGNTSYADKLFYPLQSAQNGVQQVLVYAQHNYAADKFVLYVKYNNGIVAELKQGTDKEYTVGTLDTITNTVGTFNVNMVSQANPVEDTNVTARGTGNFSGDITKYYTAMYSDFDWKDGKTPEDDDWGGSADNPYVISTPEHLLRLSQIVNGGKAWNSIKTTNTDLCISRQDKAVAKDRAYRGAYFLVTADIDMTGNVSTDGVYNFLPIGHRNEQSQTDMPFSGTFDGNGKAITFVYNVNRNNFYNNSEAHSDYVGLFGYIAGYKVGAEQKYATIKNLSIESMDGNEVDDNGGIIGKDYVGGIAGYAVDSKLYNVSMMYGSWVRGENYVGGIVGYADNTWLGVGNEHDNAITYANVGGIQYVGGIVGKWIVRSEEQIGGGKDKQEYITTTLGTDVNGTQYVGGLVGWLDTSTCTDSVVFAPIVKGSDQNKNVVKGTEYVGALFGVVVGNGYHQSATQGKYTAIVISDQKVNNITLQTNTNAKVVGGLVGYAESVGILFETDWNTSSTIFTLDDSTSFFGGVVGVLGKNSTIEAIIVTKEGDGSYLTGSEHTILNNTALGASGKPIGSFVGGIVGYVSSQAGTYLEANTTIFGNGISLVNSGQIHATGYVGGIFGALGDIPASVASSFGLYTDSILYKVLTTGVKDGSASTTLGLAPTVDSAYFTGAKGKLVNSASLSVTDGYVGGIAGYSGAKVRFVLRNTPQTGAIATANLNVYSGGNDIYINGSYAGGIAGYLVDNLEHELQYIVVQAKFDNANAKRVGGLVGYMGSGKVENCVVTNGGNSNVNELTDTFKGSEYVGGLVGETQNAIIRNSVSTGFNLEKTTNTKGGVLGGGTNPTIESSWTFYIAKSGATYQTVSKNTYGKYILVDTDIVTTNGSSYPTFAKLCEFTGITENGTAGVLEFDVNMPRYDLNVNLKNKQLAFYDASGSDTVSTNFDSGAVNGFENKVKEIENINNVVTTKLDMASGTSMQICVVNIEFVNISKWNSTNPLYNTADGAQQNVENAYKKPSNSSRYVVDVTNNNDGTIATNPKRIYDDDGNTRYILANVYFNWQATDGTVRFVPIGSSNADYVSDRIGTYDSEDITPGSSAENPLTISNQKEWNDFAWSIYTGTNDYAGQYVKLLTNDIVINTGTHYGTASSTVPLDFSIECTPNAYNSDTKNAKSNLGYNFAGNISQGSSEVEKVTVDGVQGATTPSFKGHFDGNGNTIEITYTSGGYHRISVFPNASNATFQNLTIKGTIVAGTNTSNSGYDIAAFVGKPFGAITFTNCTAAVDIQGLRVIAGFSGYSSSTSPITLIGCVNKGNITSYEGSEWTKNPLQDIGYPKDYSYGTGGLIAYATNDITIDSCLNTGNVVGQTKVGGLVGRVTAFTTIQNSANTGNITGEETNPYNDTDPKNKAGNAWSRVGGLVGEASKTATLKMYACYNTGAIRGKSNIAGGLVGILGTIPSKEKPHSTEADNTSTIAYCYNTGEVTVGWDKFSGIVMIGGSGYNFNGTDAGGLVGVAVKLNIEYSYNTGDIHGYGGVGYRFSWQVRNGGILAEACTNASNHSITIANCYSTGRIYIEENNGTSNTRYSADIIGYMDGEAGNDSGVSKVTVSDCYGIAKNIVSYEKNNIKYFSGWNNQSGGNVKYVRTGTTLNSLSDLTAIMRADGSVKPRAFYYANNQNNEVELWNASTSTIGAQNTTDYQNGTLGGYVYVYGCLPQLAVFAVDTYNGLSMNSQNFGKDIYGEYKAQKAGEEYSPYVIRDGIDLMGVQTLVGLGYTFDGKYIEFANGSNNITLDKNLSSDVAKAINMPISNSTSTKIDDSENAYKSLGKDNTYHIGKSYHLFKLSAVCYDDNNIAQNTAYGYWLSSNHYYNGAYGEKEGAYKNYGTFKTQNILTIGRNGKVFKGSISGKQENNANTVINNLRITSGQTTGGAYGGLFGHVDNAYIGYIEVGGESNIWAYSSDNQQIAATGAIAGYVTGDSIIEHCAVSGTTAIGAYGKNDDTHIASDITYAGGIVGLVNPKKGTQYEAGISAIIKYCTVNISTTTGDRAAFAGIIQACKSNIGGVLGYVGGDAGANEKGNSVRIEGCEVQKAAIQAASSAKESSHIGGVLGYGSDYVAAFITGCSVGNGADTVTIKGEHSLGGIAGGMSNAKGGYIDSCIVGEKATIERINQGGGTVSENPKHGTAIGGLVGFTEDSTDTTSPLTTTFSGTSAFNGTITVSVEASYQSSTLDAKISCIGGIVGDMGSGANFASGSDVTVDGTINITLAAANVGGVAGRTNTATFIGNFVVKPNMQTDKAENVGGFIGKNVGTVYILADTTERIVDGKLNGTNITIGGTIRGTSEVGGFIGVNNSGSSLNIGSNVANAKPYRSGTLSITIENGTITGGDNVGGIVGKNEGADGGASYASIDIVKGTITQQGTIQGANYVGGIIGLNDGLLTTGGGEADTSIGGTTLDENQIGLIKNLSITNNGNVTGSGNYVGGVVGKLDSPAEDSGKGAIAGTFTNSGTVVGNNFVGGSLGFVGKNVTITAKNNVATLFVNDGEVNATGYFVGGSIGALVGKIQGENSSVVVKFENKKKVNATGFVGGSIGVLAGPVSYAQFVNSSDGLEIAAVNSVGGSVGYIGVPLLLSDELVGFTAHQIDINNTHFEASGNLTANPSQDAINAAKKDKEDNGWGGVGGAIGVMGAAINSWKDNTYYANGNVKANVIEDGIETGIYNVGGIVGLINAGNITISNMLAYRTIVTGGKNVGGIVGATTGAKTVINSAYAIEGTFSATSATKGAGDNVGGIIGLAKDDTDASTSYWVKGYANSDIATYDVKDLSKLGFTTGKATTGWFFLYANDATGANGLGTINTSHSTNSDLQYWKRIADAYTASERQTKIKDETGVEYTLATIPLKSDIVKDKDINGADTKSPQKSTLYATATAAEANSQYYMYTATSNDAVKPQVEFDDTRNGYFISVKTNDQDATGNKRQAQNVAVFYRKITKGSDLTYNGYARNAVVGMDGVGLLEQTPDETTVYDETYRNKYFYTTSTSIDGTTATTAMSDPKMSDPNTYKSTIKIYFFDGKGKARIVGGIDDLEWTIKARELSATFIVATNRKYGEDSNGSEGENKYDMFVSISNIAPNRGKQVPIKLDVSVGNDIVVTFTWDGTVFKPSKAGSGITLSSIGMIPSEAMKDSDTMFIAEEQTDGLNTQVLNCYLVFTEAKAYTVTINTSDVVAKPRYTIKNEEATGNFTVSPAELRLERTSGGSHAFDNTSTHGAVWKITGFVYKDGFKQLAQFNPVFHSNGQTENMYDSGGLKNNINFTNGSVVQATQTDGVNKTITITLSTVRTLGDYYIEFNAGKVGENQYRVGNYELSFVKGQNEYHIVKTTIKITSSTEKGGAYTSKVYNQKTASITVMFTASADGDPSFNGIMNFEDFLTRFFGVKDTSKFSKVEIPTSSSDIKKTVSWTFTTKADADNYVVALIEGKDHVAEEANCAHDPDKLPSYTYKIKQRPVTISVTQTGSGSYTYNTKHQGLDTVSVNQGSQGNEIGLLADDLIEIKISGSVSKPLKFKNEYSKSAGISTIDAGTYSVSFALSTATSYTQNRNYTLSVSSTSKTEWIINQYVVKVGNLNVGTDKVYDARAVVPTISIEGMSGDGKTFTYHNDTVTISYSITKVGGTSYSGNKLVNAGQYTISIGGTNSGSIKANRTGTSTDTSKNYTFGNATQKVQYNINSCPIEIVWEMKTFVYNASNQMLSISGIKIGENDTVVAVFSADKVKGLGDDTLVFNRTGGGTDVGVNHTTTAELASVIGTNDEVPSIRENYTIKAGATSGEFTITPFVVNISFNTSAGAILNKVYNANDVVPQNQIKDSYFTWSKISGTNLPSSNPFTITGKYDNKNVGTGKGVTFTYTFTDPSGKGNYKAGTVDTAQHNVGQITPAHIKVALDKLRSGKATRTFTNNEWYGGQAGASSGEKDGKSTVYRSGEGFRISGVFGNDDIKVVAKYAEAGDDRAMFDKYVNDIVKNADETFAKAKAGTHLKMLVFEMTGVDAKNYTFNVYNKLGTDGKKYSEKDSTAGDKQTVTVYDTDDKANGHQNASGADTIHIEITVKTYKVEYKNTAQSYANADNTYNTNWERVGVSNNPPGVTVTVSNGWMYADGQDHGDDEQAEKKVYKAYTTIRGSQNSVRLGAKISGIDGMELNYKMVNQPILTIGYFVVDNNDVFEIGSASSLMIASYYWWVAQNGQNPDFNLPLVATSTWHKIVSNDDYMTKPFEKPSDAPNDVDMTGWDWDMYFAWFEQQNNVKIFLNETGIPNEDGTWGYYTTGEESQQKQYTKYRMVRDFSGKLTESDIAILAAFFPKEKGWGVGKTYLDNFLNSSVGSVLTAVGSVFRWYNGSVGQFEFDGNGYVIEYLNIMGYDKENVGLFDIIGANGIVKNLHLRNITINANQGNVGGIAGSIAAADGDADATKNVTNVSFHGKITATGGTVGGLFGTSARAIDGAIVLGEISATGASAGGVVGTATADLTKVVSIMQITASGDTVGAFTSDNAHVGENCTHMTNAVWKKGTSGTGLNVDGKNVGYNALMSGSNSLYANGTSDSGTYDVINEEFADSGQNANPRQSKRLRDMVSVYLLMYSLSVNNGKYTISSSSWLVGTADGTNAKPIVIANKQNVSLLRELRFAAFMLKANVSIDIASTFSGAFYGSVTSETDKNYKITCNKPMFEAYATEPTVWLVTPTQP